MARTNVAIVGAGFIGPVHIEALRRLALPVVGILGLTPEEARPTAERLAIPTIYNTLEELLADDNVDVVHIASPNHLHFPMVSAAIKAGKHVLCEKPLAMNSQQSAELLALAKEHGRVNAVNFNIRFYPISHHARDLVQTGELGKVYAIHGSYLQDWLLYETDWNWRLEPEFGGAMRAVADIGSHWLDLLTFITGERIDSVFADFATCIPVRQKPKKEVGTYTGKLETARETTPQEIKTEDYATVLLRFAGGAHGVMTVCQVAAGRKNRLSFEIDAAKSSIAFDSERPNELWVGHRERPNEILLKDPSLLSDSARGIASYPGGHNEGFPDTFKQLYSKFYADCRNGAPSENPDYPTFADGHYALQLGDAILASATEGRWAKVGE